AIMLKALADRLAEAFAELIHEKIRKEYWAYSKDENLSLDDLFKSRYQGIRPAFGYPACPEHSEKQTLFNLLDVENNIQMKLTENFSMYPAASVSAMCFSHPQSKYFNLGRITKEQIEDYAQRKNISNELAMRYLAVNLADE
ncbi:MAG: methionine synthase, partial [Bacteroidales bacterium]|nr:methionine synthase [Bacteroidales bacterium]